MQKYELFLKNDRIKAYKTLILFFIAVNIIFFMLLAFQDNSRSRSLLVVAVVVFSLVLENYLSKKNKKYSGKGVTLLYFVLGYLLLHYWWMALAVIIVAIFYAISIRKLIVYVNSTQIIYPSFPKRIYDWSDLSNIILKDDLLTIDFKDNRIIQQLTEKTEHPVNEKEFNDFCKSHLETANIKK
ncbi:MAG: hypothetical protein ACXWWC_02015 [Chitinophagaceae bacterium]